MSNVNPNNPPPQGFGTQLFQWIVENILFIKRRINAITGSGGSGGSLAIGDPIEGADPYQVLLTDGFGNLGQGGPTYQSGSLSIAAAGSTIHMENLDDGSLLDFTVSTSEGGIVEANVLGVRTTIHIPVGDSDQLIHVPINVSGTFALEGYVNALLVEKLSIDGSNAMTGTLDAGGQLISDVATCIADTDAANKAYVDAFVTGLSPKTAVRVATTTALVGTYDNGVSGVGATFTMTATGVLAVDGVDLVLGNRVLIKNQVAQLQNGIYDVTTEGIIGVATVFTRTTDNDTDAEMVSAYTYTGTEGATQASTGYVQGTPAPVVGTDPIVWNLFNSSIYSAGTGIRIGSNVIYNRLSEGVTGGQTAIGGTAADDTFTIQGSNSVNPRTTTAPAIIINSAGAFGGSSGVQVFQSVPITVNQSGTAGYTAIRVPVTETAVGTTGGKFLEFLGGSGGATSKFSIANTGTISIASGANLFSPGVNTIGNNDYTLVLADNQRLIRANFSTNHTITIPPNASVAFPTEAKIDILAFGAGTVTFVAGSGVTIHSYLGRLSIAGQYAAVTLIQIAANTWALIGQLV